MPCGGEGNGLRLHGLWEEIGARADCAPRHDWQERNQQSVRGGQRLLNSFEPNSTPPFLCLSCRHSDTAFCPATWKAASDL